MEEVIINKTKLRISQGDITKSVVDIIVNAANSSLLGGGGVDGAIHKAGGKVILEECVKIRNQRGGCNVGEVVFTKAGNLAAQYVIHTVGPVWNGGMKNEEDKLRSCYRNTLKLAAQLNAKSIAIPNISTGIYKFPKELAIIALDEVLNYLRENNVESLEYDVKITLT
jgi:O-acetyl-ADP-ribose deacetylase (regulator of RNase III)